MPRIKQRARKTTGGRMPLALSTEETPEQKKSRLINKYATELGEDLGKEVDRNDLVNLATMLKRSGVIVPSKNGDYLEGNYVNPCIGTGPSGRIESLSFEYLATPDQSPFRLSSKIGLLTGLKRLRFDRFIEMSWTSGLKHLHKLERLHIWGLEQPLPDVVLPSLKKLTFGPALADGEAFASWAVKYAPSLQTLKILRDEEGDCNNNFVSEFLNQLVEEFKSGSQIVSLTNLTFHWVLNTGNFIKLFTTVMKGLPNLEVICLDLAGWDYQRGMTPCWSEIGDAVMAEWKDSTPKLTTLDHYGITMELVDGTEDEFFDKDIRGLLNFVKCFKNLYDFFEGDYVGDEVKEAIRSNRERKCLHDAQQIAACIPDDFRPSLSPLILEKATRHSVKELRTGTLYSLIRQCPALLQKPLEPPGELVRHEYEMQTNGADPPGRLVRHGSKTGAELESPAKRQRTE